MGCCVVKAWKGRCSPVAMVDSGGRGELPLQQFRWRTLGSKRFVSAMLCGMSGCSKTYPAGFHDMYCYRNIPIPECNDGQLLALHGDTWGCERVVKADISDQDTR